MNTTSVQTAIPALRELQIGQQWVCFNSNKEPFNPHTGKPAKANDSSTWGTYEQAQARVTLSSGKFAGVGYEFQKEQRRTGVDLDHCIDEKGQISDFAREIIHRLDSYTEYSPSGHGLHIWVHGTIPNNVAPNKPEPDGIEMYDHGRYFTVTGRHYPGSPETIEDRQEQLQALYLEVTERRRAAKKRAPVPAKGASASLPAGDTPYGLKALEDECHTLSLTKSGARNDQLNTSAYSMGQLIAGHELTRSTVERELDAVAARIGLGDHEIEATIRSGIEAGMQEPRTAPVKERLADYKPSRHTLGSASNGNGNRDRTGDQTDTDEQPLPNVFIAGQLREYTDSALAALRQTEEQDPMLFVQSARLVKIGFDEKRRPIILHIGTAELRNALTQAANFYRLKEKEDEWVPVEIAPPRDLAEAILGLEPHKWPFPALEAIVETPVLRPDGSILDTPGYDPATRLYYIPQSESDMQACKVPAQPTQADIDQALALLVDAIGDFPYTCDADKANTLALLMTPILRPAIRRHIPLALIDAPKPGTGKGLLADTAAIIATGNTASNLTAPDNEDEWDKRITAMLMEGRSIICIDNIAGTLRSAALDSTLTSDEKEGRVLGLSRMVKVANRATWLATGNNLKLGGDLARRCYRIRLDPQVSRPWLRTGFKHEDLASWVLEHRSELIAAVLTLARAWFLAGQPTDKEVPPLGTFNNWTRILGGILKFVGVTGFLTNLEKLYEEADEDSGQWEAFLQAWRISFGEKAVKVAEVIKILTAGSDENAGSVAGSSLIDALPENLQIALRDKPSSFAIRLGKALEKRVDTRFGLENLCLKKEFDTNAKQKLWRVIAGSTGSAITHAVSEKLPFDSDESNDQKNQSSNDPGNYPYYPQGDNHGKLSAGSTGGLNGVSGENADADTLPANEGPGAPAVPDSFNYPSDAATLAGPEPIGSCRVCRMRRYIPRLKDDRWVWACAHCHPEVERSQGLEYYRLIDRGE